MRWFGWGTPTFPPHYQSPSADIIYFAAGSDFLKNSLTLALFPFFASDGGEGLIADCGVLTDPY